MLNKSELSKIIINELKDKHHYINISISSTPPYNLCFNYFECLNKDLVKTFCPGFFSCYNHQFHVTNGLFVA